MSSLVVEEGGRHGLVTLVDQRADARVTLVCSVRDSAGVVIVPDTPMLDNELDKEKQEPKTEEPDKPRPGPPKEYRPYMFASANQSFDAEGFQLVVDTSLLELDQLRFGMPDFVARAVAYGLEGYPRIQIQPSDAEEWGVFALVAAR